MIIEDKLMKFVLFQKRTTEEVRRKCSNLKYDENTIEEIINYLSENNYINDEEYVKLYISNVMKLKYISINALRYELLKKGIKDEIINNNIYDEKLSEYEYYACQKLVEKKMKSMEKEKLKRYLLSKGFRYEVVDKSIDNIDGIEDN